MLLADSSGEKAFAGALTRLLGFRKWRSHVSGRAESGGAGRFHINTHIMPPEQEVKEIIIMEASVCVCVCECICESKTHHRHFGSHTNAIMLESPGPAGFASFQGVSRVCRRVDPSNGQGR